MPFLSKSLTIYEEGFIEQLKDIWLGWLQFGVGDTTRWFYFFLDVLLITTALTFVLRAFNTKRTISYLSLIGLDLTALIVSAYFTLPGLHILSQAFLVILIIGLPLFLDVNWLNLFSPKTESSGDLPYLSTTLAIVLSLLGAFLVTGVASGVGGKTAQLPQGVPMVAVNLPEGMSAGFGDQVSASVIVSASSDKWRSLTSSSFSATVDVAKQGEGTYYLPVTVTSKVQDVTIVRVKPAKVTVTVEPVIHKTVPVVAQFSGHAGTDLVPDDPVIDPIKVEASGPKSVLDDLTQAVFQVRLNGETQTITQKYSLVALTPSGEVIGSVTFDPTEVSATIALVKAGKLKTVGIRPVLTGQPTSGYWVKNVNSDPTVVSITGTADALASLTEVTTQPISVGGLSASTTLSTTLNLPSGVTVADDTTKISVKVEIAAVATTKSINPEIQYVGLSDSLKVTSVNPSTVTVLVSGPASALAGLNGSEVKLKLNLAIYLSAGTWPVSIKSTDFVFPDGVGLVSYLPSSVTVVLDHL